MFSHPELNGCLTLKSSALMVTQLDEITAQAGAAMRTE